MLFSIVNILLYLRHPRLIRQYRRRIGRLPSIALPRRIDEKFLWRKIFDHNPRFTEVSDKLKAKDYARRVCPGIKCPEVLWEGRDPGDIPDQLFERNVVVKANHGWDFNELVFAGAADRPALERKARRWMAKAHHKSKGEWAYRNIERKLFVEEMICDGPGPVGQEFKVHVAGGRAVFTFHLLDRFNEDSRSVFFDRDGNYRAMPSSSMFRSTEVTAPAHYPEIIRMAERLAAPFDYIRCDFFDLDGTIYLGEFTVYPMAGFTWIGDPDLAAHWNESWDLRKSWFLTSPQAGLAGLYARALKARLDREGASGNG